MEPLHDQLCSLQASMDSAEESHSQQVAAAKQEAAAAHEKNQHLQQALDDLHADFAACRAELKECACMMELFGLAQCITVQ